MEIIVERFYFFLEYKDAVGDLMVESRGGKEDTRLKNAYKEIYEKGSNFIEREKFQNRFTSKQLKVKSKKTILPAYKLQT
jgi:hypothetical protein